MALWQNRIVGYGEERPDQLLANDANWRIHPEWQRAALSGILSEVGIVQNIIVNVTTGNMVDGHLRADEADRTGQPTIPVTYVKLTLEEERKILATFDPLSAIAVTDGEKLSDLLEEVGTADPGVQKLLDHLNESAEIFSGEQVGGGGADPLAGTESEFTLIISVGSAEEQSSALERLQNLGYSVQKGF